MIRNEKGSVTLMVLLVCMFILVALLLANINIINKNQNQRKQFSKIEESYTVTEAQMEKEYMSIK